jgi:NAD(P)-dependent dehydrogenase (short-subunit alcohol dehydrogenase family)
MKLENFGMIVNIGSLAGILPNFHNSLYSISKAALEMLTKSMALEWAANNIRVNSVIPAGADSKMAKALYKTKQKLDARKKAIPTGELVSCKEIAKAALFLASSDLQSITGTSLILDGGSSISYFRLVDIYGSTIRS